jgi:flagellin-like hook-associated protein FlgL
MSLTITSNLTASIANRSLQTSNAAMERSLSKLASGSRVQSARDDAASMAIGSRIKAELVGLKTYQQNATQATSMLQMADGAYARGQDMLIRMKALATQAQSGNLSNVERGMLDTEFQQLKSEISRLASSTQFSGQTLVGSVNTPTYGFSNYLNASTTQSGTQGNAGSAGGTGGISDDGQWTTFTSSATNLDSAADGSTQLYLKNLFTGEIRMISKNAAGALADGLVSVARISGDGRTVYFTSAATNLAGSGADGSTLNLYKYDVSTGVTAQIMPTVSGAQPFADITGIRTSADGRYVSFITSAANIVAGDTNGTQDVFVYDNVTQTTIRASMSGTGQQTSAGGGITTAEVSNDGRFVTYTSTSSDTVSNDLNGVADVFIFDRQTGTSTLVSKSILTGNSGNAVVSSARISGDGRYVSFTTAATDLIAGGSNLVQSFRSAP